MSDPDPSAVRSPILRYFSYGHLPTRLQLISQPFGELAETMEQLLPSGPEKSVALRKLLEGKDAAVRAFLPESGSDEQ